MTWRTVVVSSNSKLDLRMNYLVVRNTEIRKVHLSEISLLIIESTAVSMTSMLLCELSRRKIKVIFCDETHNPYGELITYHGSHDCSSKLRSQIQWGEEIKGEVWRRIIREKITKQSLILARFDLERSMMLQGYAEDVLESDSSNREGHSAKVYFNTIFGDGFSRKKSCVENSCLDYGYAILLSSVNREIAALGYSTELGIFHDNMYNRYNLGSDLMEPLRPLVDRMVLDLAPAAFSTECKRALAGILNQQVMLDGRRMHLSNAMPIYVKSVTDALENDDPEKLRFCDYEGTCDEVDSLLRSARQDIGRAEEICEVP